MKRKWSIRAACAAAGLCLPQLLLAVGNEDAQAGINIAILLVILLGYLLLENFLQRKCDNKFMVCGDFTGTGCSKVYCIGWPNAITAAVVRFPRDWQIWHRDKKIAERSEERKS
jgi:hypothetical protein